MYAPILAYLMSVFLLLPITLLANPLGTESSPPDAEQFLLLDIEKIDEIMGVTSLTIDGENYRQRNLDPIIDFITQHTDDDHHGHGEHYQNWRQHLRSPHPTVATLNRYFDQAAQEFQVPSELLKAIAFVETNWTQIGPSIDQGWGIMHLVHNNYADTLTEAANLLKLQPEILKNHPQANIRGAAALLAHQAAQLDYIPSDLIDWWPAVAHLTGLISASLRDLQTQRYYQILQTGAKSSTLWEETLLLPSYPKVNLEHQRSGSRAIRSADYSPAASRLTSCNYTTEANRNIDTWVNHWIGQGTYAGAISWFQNCQAKASAHFIVSATGEITQVVPVKHIAWHAGVWSYNQRSIGVEHEVTLSNPNGWNTTWQPALLEASAKMASYFMAQYSIPKVRSKAPGILGHNEIKTTTCPGTLPWEKWLNYLDQGLNVYDFWKKADPIHAVPAPGTQVNFDAQFKIKNAGNQPIIIQRLSLGLYNENGEFITDLNWANTSTPKYVDNLTLAPGQNYWFEFATATIRTAGNYTLRANALIGGTWKSYAEQTIKVLAPLSTVTSIQTFVWHGNGSVLSHHGQLLTEANRGTDWPFGITQDTVQLHAVNTEKPVALFQWQIGKNGCTRLKLTAPALDIKERGVDITIGNWDLRETDITFSKVTLPFVLGEQNTQFSLLDGSWMVVKVAFLQPLTRKARLEALCTEESPTTGTYQVGGGESQVMEGEFTWHGNASVISHQFKHLYGQTPTSIDWPFGVFQDVTFVHPSLAKPMVFFQWQIDPICSQLTLSAPDLSESEKKVDVNVKAWNESFEEAISYRNQILPITIPSNQVSPGGWELIQVRFQQPVSRSATVEAKCQP